MSSRATIENLLLHANKFLDSFKDVLTNEQIKGTVELIGNLNISLDWAKKEEAKVDVD